MALAVDLESLHNDARPEDVETIDGILRAFYEVISGPAGAPRQWSRDRTLYAPGALLVSSGKNPAGERFTIVMDPEGYINRVDERLRVSGFFEQEVDRHARSFGSITHVFSAYEARHQQDGPVIARGVNSIELVHAANRWWIVAALWDNAASASLS